LLPRLRSLGLDDNRITAYGLRALLTTQGSTLEELACCQADLDDEAARAIAESPGAASLKRLRLGYNSMGPRGLAALVRSPHLANLRHLGLEQNRVGNAGARALLESPLMDRLESLRIYGNAIGRPTQARLRQRHSPTQTIRL